MAKNDYFVLLCKMLVYLYRHLKGDTKTKPEEYLLPMTKDFPIGQEYFFYLLEEAQSHELIKGVQLVRDWSGEILSADVSGARITPEGIGYLQENKLMRKIVRMIPAAASIAELFN